MPDQAYKHDSVNSARGKAGHWKRWSITIICVLLLVTLAGWMLASREAGRRVKQQLAELDFGSVQTGLSRVTTSGVTASNIRFARDGESDPWLVVGSLQIDEPLVDLATGSDDYDRITLSDVEVRLDADELLSAASSGSDVGFDLAGLELPSSDIVLKNVLVRVTQPGRDDLVIPGIDATVLGDESGSIQIDANVREWLKSDWNVSAEIRKDQNEVDLVANADSFQLPENWQDLPGMPADLDQYLDATGTASLAATVGIRDGMRLNYRAIVSPEKINLRLPAFDLLLKIGGGQAVVSDGRVQLQQLIATSDGTEVITVDGLMNIDAFPVEVAFNAAFEELAVATVRKIVPDIPTEAVGRATGETAGAVSISDSLQTTLQLTAAADNLDASYGALEAGPSTTKVQLDSLRLSSDFELLDLQGNVTVHATPKQQSADRVFETFQLTELQHQLNVKAIFDAEMDLVIPLATAGNLETWLLEIKAEAETGTLDEQPVEQIQANVRLDGGNLLFDDLAAVVPGTANGTSETEIGALGDGQIQLELDWPLTNSSRHADHGRLKVSARQLPAEWALAVGQSQIQTANEELDANDRKVTVARSRRASVRRKNNQPWVEPATVNGWLNADAEIKIDVGQPDNIRLWQLQGSVTNSVLGTDIEQLNQLTAAIELQNGQLKIDRLSGQLKTGDTVKGIARLDVLTGELSAASVESASLPFAWALETTRAIRPELTNYFQSVGIRPAGNEQDVGGRIALSLSLTEEGQDAESWQLIFQAESKELVVGKRTLEKLSLTGSVDQQHIRLDQFSARAGLANADPLTRVVGDLEAEGRWNYVDQQGRGRLRWNRTPNHWVAGWLGSDGMSPQGTTSGSLNLESVDGRRAFPAEIQGRVSFNRLGLSDRFYTSADLQVETDLDASQLIVKSTEPDDGSENDAGLNVTVSLQAPYNYSGTLKFDSMSLSAVNEAADSPGGLLAGSADGAEVRLPLAGVMTGSTQFAGQLQPLRWSTKGAVSVIKPSIGRQDLSDVKANWNFDNQGFTRSKAEFEIFGGQIKLAETIAHSQRIGVSIDGLNAGELSALAGPSFPMLEGQLSGEASINEWDAADKTWADLRLKGASSKVTGVRLTDLGAEVEYRQKMLKYSVSGRTLEGAIAGDGSVSLDVGELNQITLPLELVVERAQLQRLAFESNRYQSVKPLRGGFSTKLQLAYDLKDGFAGNGQVQLASVTWNDQLITRLATADVRVKSGVAELDNVQADLRRGKISGRAIVPLAGVTNGSAMGNYQINIQQFDLERFLEGVMQEPPEASGFFDARLTGHLGQTITGRGTIGFDRAKIYGVAADSLKVPVQFRFDPGQLAGRAEVRQSTVRALHGRITGEAALDFGRTMNVDVDLNLSKIDTADLFSGANSLSGQSQGKLSGQLVIRGRGVSRSRDLKGRFTGSLDRAQAFRVPLLSDIGNVIGGGRLGGSAYDSDQIDLRLTNDRISINSFQLEGPLASVAIGGTAYLDGRLDLAVAARIDNLDQTSGVGRLAGVANPLSVLQLNPVAQAADFLSGRNVFAKVGGTISRPVVRLDAGQQLRFEAARYFLRERQILPNSGSLND